MQRFLENIFNTTAIGRLIKGQQQRVPVLMYHKVANERSDNLTVTVAQLAQQLAFLNDNNYQYISIAELQASPELPQKAVLLTFDDAYANNLEYAYPVLKEYGAKATIFVPTAFVGQRSSWDANAESLLSTAQLRQLDKTVFELGFHSHTHLNFKDATPNQMRQEIAQNVAFFIENNLSFVPAFAYPYGGRPQNAKAKQEMYALFQEFGIQWAFRIGNRLNGWPFANRYEIQRLDVRGNESFAAFKDKVKWGKFL